MTTSTATSPPSTHPAPAAIRRILIVVGALLLVAVLTAASVTLITPDVLTDPCDRPQLVSPTGCVPE